MLVTRFLLFVGTGCSNNFPNIKKIWEITTHKNQRVSKNDGTNACPEALSSVWNCLQHHLFSHSVTFGKQCVQNGRKDYSTLHTVLNHFTKYNIDETRMLVTRFLLFVGPGCSNNFPNIKKIWEITTHKNQRVSKNDGTNACPEALSSVWNCLQHHLSSHSVTFGKQCVQNGRKRQQYITYSTESLHKIQHRRDSNACAQIPPVLWNWL